MSTTMEWSFTQTAIGWLVMLGLSSAAYFYYTRESRQKSKVKGNKGSAFLSDSDGVRSKRRERNAGNTSDSASGANSKQKKLPKLPIAAQAIISSKGDIKDEIDDADLKWAQELENKQKGGTPVIKSKPTATRQHVKTVKQSNANKVAADMSGETSTTGGADADDDFSPSLSPELSSTDYNVPVAGDISDMLEAPAKGPSILRVVLPEYPEPQRVKKEFKPPKQEETKRQRQNRRKAEDRKTQREEDEKVRKSLLEKQLRTAREARNEPAKNGMAPPPAVNAWNSKPQAPSKVSAPLLDTFDGNGWQKELPSEEEQMRILMETDETAWKTVSKKGKGKRKNTLESEQDLTGGAVQSIETSIGTNGLSNGIH